MVVTRSIARQRLNLDFEDDVIQSYLDDIIAEAEEYAPDASQARKDRFVLAVLALDINPIDQIVQVKGGTFAQAMADRQAVREAELARLVGTRITPIHDTSTPRWDPDYRIRRRF